MKHVFPVCFILLLTTLPGCGGGTKTDSADIHATPVAPRRRTVVPRITVAWGDRSRSIGKLSSALSAVVRLQGAKTDTTDLVFVINRLDVPGRYDISVKAPDAIYEGQWPLTVTFCAQSDGGGAIVGMAEALVETGNDGMLPDVAVAKTIQKVEVTPNQQLRVGEQYDLHWSAYASDGSLVAVTPGSATMAFLYPTECVRLIDGRLEGLLAGRFPIVIVVDDISSEAIPVLVTAE